MKLFKIGALLLSMSPFVAPAFEAESKEDMVCWINCYKVYVPRECTVVVDLMGFRTTLCKEGTWESRCRRECSDEGPNA